MQKKLGFKRRVAFFAVVVSLLLTSGCVVKKAAKVPVKATKGAAGLILPYQSNSGQTPSNNGEASLTHGQTSSSERNVDAP